jgi:hypothetical protein
MLPAARVVDVDVVDGDLEGEVAECGFPGYAEFDAFAAVAWDVLVGLEHGWLLEVYVVSCITKKVCIVFGMRSYVLLVSWF